MAERAKKIIPKVRLPKPPAAPPTVKQQTRFDGTPGARVWTTRERQEQVQRLEQLMLLMPGVTEPQIKRVMREQHGCGRGRTVRLMRDIWARWARDDQEQRPHLKEQAVRRMSNYLVKASQRALSEKATPADWELLMTIEVQLARLQGTNEPIVVKHEDVVVNALVPVLSDLTPEQVEKYHEEWKQTQQMADQYARENSINIGPTPLRVNR